MTQNFDDPTPADSAVKQRLHRLDSLPVDLSAFDRQLKQQLPPQTRRRHWLAPLSALAASILIVLSVALFALNGSTARAEPNQMIQFHENVLAGRVPEAHTISIEEARAIISAQLSGRPLATAPNNLPPEHLMACCMTPLKNKNVTCVMLEQEGIKITLSLAQIGHMAPLAGSTVPKDGRDYHLQQVRDFTMVMVDQGSLRLCLVGRLPSEQLLKLASELKF